MKIVKNTCKNCGYSETFTKKELAIKYFLGLVKEIFFVLGILFIVLIILIGPSIFLDNFGSAIMMKSMENNVGKNELRTLAINWTEGTCSDKTLCYAEKIFNHTKNIPYVPASKFELVSSNLSESFKGNDCKNTAILYTALMRSVGQDTQVICSVKYAHCVSKVNIDSTNYLIIDLTGPKAYLMNNTQQPWTYFNEGVEIWN